MKDSPLINPSRQRRFKSDLRPVTGIPPKVVDAFLDSIGCDESQLTLDSQLVEDLGADEMDLAELADTLEHAYPVVISDEALDWVTVSDVMRTLKKAGAHL